jgi:hypothetical protein
MMKGTNYAQPHHANFLSLLRRNVRRGPFSVHIIFNMISRIAGKHGFIEPANEEGSVGVNI